MIESTAAGIGPHKKPWPVDEWLDIELLESGDRRNVADRYRYWKVAAIKEDMALHSIELEIAVENLDRDFNMGTIVRTANAFAVRKVHVIGRRQWNKRGAMMTDHYINVVYHYTIEDFITDISDRNKVLIALDTGEGALPLAESILPINAVLLFGSEARGISAELLARARSLISIEQFGSTRSLNVGVAAGIALYMWVSQNVLTPHR